MWDGRRDQDRDGLLAEMLSVAGHAGPEELDAVVARANLPVGLNDGAQPAPGADAMLLLLEWSGPAPADRADV